jgi:hypothetical protein
MPPVPPRMKRRIDVLALVMAVDLLELPHLVYPIEMTLMNKSC